MDERRNQPSHGQSGPGQSSPGEVSDDRLEQERPDGGTDRGGPAPGSPEAVDLGCSCSVLLNQGSERTGGPDATLVNPLCPVHRPGSDVDYQQ
jgi:hypothetical protein